MIRVASRARLLEQIDHDLNRLRDSAEAVDRS
jgi:hypothetical protein